MDSITVKASTKTVNKNCLQKPSEDLVVIDTQNQQIKFSNEKSPPAEDKSSILVNNVPRSPQMQVKSPSSPALPQSNVETLSNMSTDTPTISIPESIDNLTSHDNLTDLDLSKLKFTGDERLIFAEELAKMFEITRMKVLCKQCNSLYRPEKMPNVLKCGHTLCFNCANRLKKNYCADCNVESVDYALCKFTPNKDLLLVATTLEEAVNAAMKKIEWSKDEKFVSKKDIVLSGLSEVLDKANSAMQSSNILQSVYSSKLTEVRKALALLQDVILKFKTFKKRFEEAYCATAILDIFTEANDYIDFFRARLAQMDGLLINILLKPKIKDDVDLTINEMDVNSITEGMKSLSMVNKECYVMMPKCSPPKYCRLSLGGNKLCVHSAETDVQMPKDLHVVDYQKLQSKYNLHGVFFLLRFKSGRTDSLYMKIEDQSLFAKQIFLLCSGERGQSFKGGRAYGISKQVIISSYLNNDIQCSDDLFSGIPDVVGREIVPKLGTVLAPRCYGKEAEICISRVDSNVVQSSCIGRLDWDNILQRIPEEEFVIEDCGQIFQIS